MTFPTLHFQVAGENAASIGALLATFEGELISRVTIWGSAHNEDERERGKSFRAAIESSTSTSKSSELPSFTTLTAPIVHVIPRMAIVSFVLSVTLAGLFAFIAYLDSLGLRYVIRDEDQDPYFSLSDYVEAGGFSWSSRGNGEAAI